MLSPKKKKKGPEAVVFCRIAHFVGVAETDIDGKINKSVLSRSLGLKQSGHMGPFLIPSTYGNGKRGPFVFYLYCA